MVVVTRGTHVVVIEGGHNRNVHELVGVKPIIKGPRRVLETPGCEGTYPFLRNPQHIHHRSAHRKALSAPLRLAQPSDIPFVPQSLQASD